MKFSFITLFPNLITPYFEDSILKRALESNIFEYEMINPREFTQDRHNKVDNAQIGGGAGMLLYPSAILDALEYSKRDNLKSKTIFLTPSGKRFDQKDALRLSKNDHLVLLCGRYEGIDERAIELGVDEVMSIGDFVLTGGELASLVVCDSIVRLLDGALGNSLSLCGESFENSLLEPPSFTKDHFFKKLEAISDYSKGNHSKITALKTELAVAKTKFHRPDLFVKYKFNNKLKRGKK